MFSFAGYIFGSLAFIALGVTAYIPANASPGELKIVFNNTIPNLPGKSLIGVLVTYPAGVPGVTPPHRHAASAFISVYVVSGSIRSQLGGESAPKVYRAGESWNENPGAHHIVSENAEENGGASVLLATFVVNTEEDQLQKLLIPDPPASAAPPTETSSAARSASFFGIF
ncbi:hypothetical protein BV898_19500 [Hypsibius exemplaris]|uniref:Cupin type-2 domain-containing protein n=1 Tax=Hypsibius exemplaris TaxID=2072580 RepID=A0A9X6RPU4_HYPEX|nr:hypothetical protein BV898_19500 [Hypsibius exemplaris]